jgi:amino acid adenylation domain-containing protein
MLSQASLASYLEKVGSKSTVARRPADELAPLSYGQEQVWLHAALAPTLPLYNETITIKYSGELNVAAFEKSLTEVVCRHEAWRTTITLVDDEPFQKVHASQRVPFVHIDLTHLPAPLREAEALRLATEAAVRLFDLEGGPLLRATLVTVADNDHRLFLTLHHLIFDGASIRRVFLPEFVGFYSDFSQGKKSSREELSLQYGDYAYWQRRKRAMTMDAAVSYWRAQLAECPALALPTDHSRPAELSFRGVRRTFEFSKALTSALKDRASREKVTLFTALFASFALLLGRLCEQEDVVVGVPFATKRDPDAESLLGYFLNTVLFRTDLSGDPQFRELLSRVQRVTIGAWSHGDVPLQDVVTNVHSSRDNGIPLVQALFSLAPPAPEIPSEWSVSEFEICSGTAKADLDVELDDKGERIVGRLVYNVDLFEAATIERIVNYWITLLTGIVEDTTRHISDLTLIPDDERRWLVQDLNKTDRSYPSNCIHLIISERAKGIPSAVAISSGGQRVTYQELDARSSQLANYLFSRGAKAGGLVALCVDRSPEMVVALLAILKTGAAYVPLDPTYPPERLTLMLEASGAALFVSHSSLIPRFQPRGVQTVYLDSEQAAISSHSPNTGMPVPSMADPAYVIFTSGSTGRPKGVEVSHRNLANLLWSMSGEPGISSEDILLSVTSICFDIAGLEIFLPLMVGAKLVLATSEEVADPLLLLSALRSSRVTIMQATPVTWNLLIEAGWRGSTQLKVLCGGEPMTQQLASALIERSKAVWNMYGPTETTIWSLCQQITSSETFVPLGRPIANTTVHVLDRHQKLAPTGVPGELYIGGDGLATRYWRQPELTTQQFPVLSLSNEPVRLYKTGDRVRRHSDGSLEFLGRLDKQVKVRGFRIELGEIEHVLNRYPTVRTAIVLKEQSEGGDAILVAYILLEAGAPQSVAEIRTHLQKFLPSYMQPSLIHVVDQMPTTLNGKIDQKRLPETRTRRVNPDPQVPLTPLEAELAKLWCKLLNIDAVGRSDSFFELGGYSSLAARLIARVTATFGKRVTLTSFIQTPTIAQLADLISGNEVSHVAVVNKGSAVKVPLIWVGPSPWQPRLTAYLSTDQPVLSFLLSEEELASTAPGYRLEDMADLMVKKIRRLNPGYAYAIAGFCQTSLLAYECAKRLQQLGHEVPLLVMGDVLPPGYLESLSFVHRSKRRLEREVFYLSALMHSLPWNWKKLLARRVGGARVMQEQLKWERFYRSGSKDPEAVREMYQALFIGQFSYVASPYSGRVLFLQSGDRPQSDRWNPASSWKNLLEEYDVFESSGDHTSIFEEPHVQVVAQRLQTALDRAVDNVNTLPYAMA